MQRKPRESGQLRSRSSFAALTQIGGKLSIDTSHVQRNASSWRVLIGVKRFKDD